MAYKEVLVGAQRRGVMVPLLKLCFLTRHVSQGRDRANRAAVNQGHVFLSVLRSQAPGQQ